jgi:hypothetical protein
MVGRAADQPGHRRETVLVIVIRLRSANCVSAGGSFVTTERAFALDCVRAALWRVSSGLGLTEPRGLW